MLEKECDTVLSWLCRQPSKSTYSILEGTAIKTIMTDEELSRIPDFNNKIPSIMSILFTDKNIRIENINGETCWWITSQGRAWISSGNTYIVRKKKSDLEDGFKEYQYKSRYFPYIISGIALIVSVISLAKSCNQEQQEQPRETRWKIRLKDKSEILLPLGDTLYQIAPIVLHPKMKNDSSLKRLLFFLK